jgi:hypothetical protein
MATKDMGGRISLGELSFALAGPGPITDERPDRVVFVELLNIEIGESKTRLR